MVCLKLWNWVVLFWALAIFVSNLSSLHVSSLRLFQGPGLHTLTWPLLHPEACHQVSALWSGLDVLVAPSLSPPPAAESLLPSRQCRGPERTQVWLLENSRVSGPSMEGVQGARGRGWGGSLPSSHPHSRSDLPESAKPGRIIGARQDLRGQRSAPYHFHQAGYLLHGNILIRVPQHFQQLVNHSRPAFILKAVYQLNTEVQLSRYFVTPCLLHYNKTLGTLKVFKKRTGVFFTHKTFNSPSIH